MAMLTMGGDLKRREKLSGRLADILSQMYLTSAALKRYHDQGQHAEDLPLLKWWCEYSLRVMQQSLDRFLINFPNRPVAWLMRRLVFPMGKCFTGPSDALGKQVANILLTPSSARERLTEGLFLPKDDQSSNNEPLSRLELAMQTMIEAAAAEKKLRTALQSGEVKAFQRQQQIEQALAQNLIDKTDADALIKADEAQSEALKVDDFDPGELTRQTLSFIAKETA